MKNIEPGLNYDFDTPVTRTNTHSLKYDNRLAIFGTEDVTPLWVADMDFAVPAEVTQAIIERALHPIYGYTLAPPSLHAALVDWMQVRHGWAIESDWIQLAPGVVPSINAAVLALTEPGDGVIVQPPVYFPFFSAASNSGRRLIENPLVKRDDRYTIDFNHLEHCAAEASMLILCSPHNPVGRVWTQDELGQILEIANRHHLTILSDEIHGDLIYPGKHHIPFAQLADNPARVITAVAPSKTFNIPGLGLSALVVPDIEQRRAIQKAFDILHVGTSNPFSRVAFESAYRHGAPWLNALMAYLSATCDEVRSYLATHLPQVQMIAPEGTYLVWIDFSGLGMQDTELHRFLVEEAMIGLSPGTLFGQGGTGHMRLNIAAPRTQVMTALERLKEAIERTIA